jgi:hypothetical protein
MLWRAVCVVNAGLHCGFAYSAFGLLQDGDVRVVGVRPEGEKVILFANVVNGADIGMVTWLLNDGQTFRDGNLAESTATFL